MGRSLVVLLIGLMEAALHQLWPSNIPKCTTSGESFRIEVRFPEEIYPITEWSLSLWLYTTTSGTQVIYMNNPWSVLTWAGTYFEFRNDQKSNTLTTVETFRINGSSFNSAPLQVCPMEPVLFEMATNPSSLLPTRFH